METAGSLGFICEDRLVLSLPTRNGNVNLTIGVGVRKTLFWAYLQGMETRTGQNGHFGEILFWAYLQGMETIGDEKNKEVEDVFWAYLQGMETPPKFLIGIYRFLVLSLPTRNGNYSYPTRLATPSSGFEPTYKEWKRPRGLGRLQGWGHKVLSLPTRNGNEVLPGRGIFFP